MVVYLDKTALPDPQPRSLVESPNTTCDIGGGCGGGNGSEEERNGAFASGEASLRTFDSNNVTFEPPSEHTLYGEQQQQTKEGAPLQMMCASRLLDGSPTVEFFSERVSSLNDEEEERAEVVETSSSLTETAKTAKVQDSKIQKSEREKNDEATDVLSADENSVESANVLVGPTQQKNEMDDTKVDDNEEATAICSLSKYVQTTNSPSRPESAQSDATEIDIAEFLGEEEENGGMAENDEAMEAEKVCQTDRKRSKVALQKKFRRPPRDSDEEESESESDGFGKHSTDIATEWAVRKAKGKNCKRGMPGGSGDAGAAQRQKQEQIKRRKERIQQHNRRLQLDKGSQSHWAEELTTPALDLVQGIPASVPAAAAQVASVKPSVFGRDAAEDSDEVVLLPSPPPAPTPKRRSRRGGKKRKRNARRKSTTAATTPTLINPVKSTAEYSYKIDNTKFIDKPGLRAMGYGVIWDENSYVELLSIEDCMPCSLEDIRDLHLDHHLKGLPAYEEEKAQIKAKKAEESGGEEKVVKEEEKKAVVMDRITIRQLKNLHKDYERRVGPSKDGLTVVRLLAVITGRHRFRRKMKVLVEWDDYSTALVDLGDLAKRALPLPHLFQEQLAKVLLTEHNYKANHRWPVLLQSELNGPRGLNEVVLPLLEAIVKRAKALKALGQTIDGALKEGIHSVFTTTAWMEFTQERHFFGGPSAAAAAKGSLKRSGRSKASTSAVPATEPYQVYLAPGTHRREDVTMRLDELERLPLHLCKSCHRFFVASDVDLLLHLLKEDVHEGFVLPPTPRDQEEVERLKAVYGKVVKLWNQAEAAAEVVKEMAATPLENGKSASKRKLQASKKETEEEKVSQKLKKLKLHNYDDEEE